MSDAEDTYGYAYRSGQRTYDWIEVRGIEHTWMVELRRARELAVRLEGRVAALEAALEQIRDCQPEHWFDDGNTGIHYTTGLGFVQGIAEAALAGTGDEVGAVVRSAVELGDAEEKLLDSQKYGDGVDESAIDAYTGKVSALREKVAALLAKQPAWEVKRDG